MTISPVRPAPERAVGNLVARRPVLIASAAVFVALCVAIWPPTKAPYDLQVYVAAAGAVLNGQDIYTPHLGDPTLLGFTYPPFAALLFAPLGAMGAGAGRLVMSVLSAVALLVIGSI